ncbi:MAG: PAS domain S-box protein [Nitrospirae bacterium]|nr:PAS domain S-box protein [Nitrospirota bacterium]
MDKGQLKIRTIIIIFALLAFLTASIGGYLFYSSLKESSVLEHYKNADTAVAEIANRISLYLSDYKKITHSLSGIKDLRKALETVRPDALRDANTVLDHFQKALAVDVCYLIDRSGTTIASSNRDTTESFVGKNYAFRPYFKQAMAGDPSVYMALGVTSGKRGVYFSHPMYTKGQTVPAGIVVVKASIDAVEKEIGGKHDGAVVMVDPHGVIFASSHADWLYHMLWKTSQQSLSDIAASQQFGKASPAWTGMERSDEQNAFDTAGNRYRIHRAPIMSSPGWEIIYLHDLELVSLQISGLKSRNIGFIIMLGSAIIGLISIILYKQASNEIKKRQLIEKEFQSTNHRLQALINASPLAITIMDSDGSCILWNPASEQVFGWTEKEVLGGPLPFIPDDKQKEFREYRRKIFEGRTFKSIETQRLRRDEVVIDVALSTAPIYDADGNITASMDIFEEITERKKAEENERLLASIIQNLPDAVCAIDKLGNTIVWNRGAEQMLGYRAEEIIGKPITDAIPQDIAQQELGHCMNILNQQEFFSGYESIRLTKDGRKIPVELTAVAIRDKEHKITNYASIMVDLTERKKAEEERLKGHMLESIGFLAGGIAHDFNNLLNVIIGNIAVTKMSMQPDDKAYGRLDDAENVCGIASELSRRLITFATGGDPLKKIISLSELLVNTISIMLKDSKIKAEFHFPDDLYRVAIDEGQMKQVVNNLIINAKEAMPNGGALTVRGENLRISAQDSYPIREGDYLKISIRDTGAGIPAENLAKIFDPYYSTKDTYSQKGLGLGLAVCYSIIKRHDGLMTVESQVGEGTTFSIYLPAVKNG